MTYDFNKQIASITYNHLNLPEEIIFVSPPDEDPDQIHYDYSAEGVKQSKLVITDNATIHRSTEYAGNYIYENYRDYSDPPPYPPAELRMFFHPEGYVQPNGSGGFDYVYQYRDQVNSVRLSYSDIDGDGSIDPVTEILDERNYYPFGLIQRGYNGNLIGAENNYVSSP